MFKKTKKLTLSDLAGSFGESENKKSRSLCSYQAENKKNRVNIGRKIKYWFSSENKEAAQHLLVIFGVLVLILLSCAAINKVENGMNFQGKQAMVESVWGGGTAETAKNEEKTNQTQEVKGEVLNNDNDYFINYEMEREKVRSEQLELLNEMAEDANTLPEVKKEAENKILAITQGMENELLLESLLVAKYGGEAVVFVQEDKVNVILRPESGKIDDGEAEKIAQLVDTYTNIGYENAIIVIKD